MTDTPGLGRLTDAARQVLDLALREALAYGQNYIGPEHLLLGIIRHRENLADNALRDLGNDTETIRNAVVNRMAGVPNERRSRPTLTITDRSGTLIATRIFDYDGGKLTGPLATVDINDERHVLDHLEQGWTATDGFTLTLTYRRA